MFRIWGPLTSFGVHLQGLYVDNTTLDSGSGGDTIATDDISGVKYPRSKIVIGADGTNDGDVSAANPLPVKGTGTAGTANTGVVTVQGIASMTAVVVSDGSSSLTVDNGGTFAVQVDGAALTALQLIDDTVYTDGTGTPSKAIGIAGTDGTNPQIIKTDASGELQVDVLSVTGTVTISGAVTNAGTFAVQESGGSLTALQIIDDWDESDRAKINPIVGQAGVAAGAGVVGATVQRTTLASDDPAVVAVQIMDDWDESDRAKVNIVAGQAGITAGAGTVGASTPRVTLASDDPAVASLSVLDDWDSGDACKVTLDPKTSGGLSVFKSTDIDESEEAVKASAGQVYAIYCVNTNSSVRYLKVYNATTANVTVGSTATVLDLLVPPSNNGFYLSWPHGVPFDTAITVAATTGVGDADSGAPGASEVQVHVFYK